MFKIMFMFSCLYIVSEGKKKQKKNQSQIPCMCSDSDCEILIMDSALAKRN